MKVLVVGCGSIGLRHIRHLRQLGIRAIEAADSNPAVCRRVQGQCGVTVHLNAERAFDRKPDVVLVCTPAATHVPMVNRALDAGAHVFVEKPLSTNLEGTDALVERVRADGRIVQVGYQLRYHPAMRATKAILESGRLGNILMAHAEFGFYLATWWPGRDYRESYMATPDQSGGLLLDVSHELDLVMWFLGKVKEVFAYGAKLSTLEIQGLDVIKVVLTMADGAVVSLNIDCLQPTYTRGYKLVGEGTALTWECSNGRADKSRGRLWMSDGTSERQRRVPVQGDPRNTYRDELRDFLSAVETGRAPTVGVECGVEVLRVAGAIQRSIETGQPVRL